MLYLGIDQHRKQLTVSLRNEAGEVVLRRQVSTRPERTREFLQEVQRRSVEEGTIAVLEVCNRRSAGVGTAYSPGFCGILLKSAGCDRSQKSIIR